MNKLAATTLLLSALAAETGAAEDERVTVKPVGSQPSAQGPADYFTGRVRVDAPFKGTGDARIGGATVTFEPGARTAWHTHPLGQTLIVTSGMGWVQQLGQPVQQIKPGDTVWIPPNTRHWHGATATTGMSHIAIAEALDGNVVTWLEKVRDDEYPAAQ